MTITAPAMALALTEGARAASVDADVDAVGTSDASVIAATSAEATSGSEKLKSGAIVKVVLVAEMDVVVGVVETDNDDLSGGVDDGDSEVDWEVGGKGRRDAIEVEETTVEVSVSL